MAGQIHRLSATRASREFSRLLDEISAGAEYVIERRSEPVAIIAPASTAPRKISDCISLPLSRPSVRPDEGFESDLREIIQGAEPGEPPTWD